MQELPPLMRDQRKIDADHLKLLSIFHYVLGGLAVVGLGFLFMHWLMMHSLFANPEMWKDQKNGPPPREVMMIFKWFYLFFGSCIVVHGLLNALSGWLILQRRARMFSLVISGLNCIAFPFGTTLGVFTFIVLLRSSVQELYETTAANRRSDSLS